MEIPEFGIIMKEISNIKALVASEKSAKDFDDMFPAQWYNDQQCWEHKGGMSLNTYRTNRFFQCKGGIPDAKVGGRNVWSRESVMEWARLSDEELPAYHEKYKTGAKRK